MWKGCGMGVEGVWKGCGGGVEGVWRGCGVGVEGVWSGCGVGFCGGSCKACLKGGVQRGFWGKRRLIALHKVIMQINLIRIQI